VDREDSGTFVLGGAILTIGAALLVDRLGILPWTARWSVWPLLLIAYGVVHLARSPWAGTKGVFPIALGVWIWASQAGWIAWRESWPLVFVLLGVAVMWQAWGAPAEQTPMVAGRRQRSPLIALAIVATILAATTIDAKHYVGPVTSYGGPTGFNRGFMNTTTAAQSNTADRMNVSVVMGDAHRTASSTIPFHGGDVYTLMGDTDLDLRNAVSDGQPITLDISVMMGDVIVRVPDAWTVDVQITPFLGEVQDRRGQPDPVRTRARNRRGGNDDGWTDQGSTGSNGSTGANGSTGSPSAPGHLVLTGSVTMGDLVIR
jgi:hypothetical protein